MLLILLKFLLKVLDIIGVPCNFAVLAAEEQRSGNESFWNWFLIAFIKLGCSSDFMAKEVSVRNYMNTRHYKHTALAISSTTRMIEAVCIMWPAFARGAH